MQIEIWNACGDDSNGTWAVPCASELAAWDHLLSVIGSSRDEYQASDDGKNDDICAFITRYKEDKHLDAYNVTGPHYLAIEAVPSLRVALPELPVGAVFNEANLETAMCLWEAMLEIRDRPDVAARFDEVGTVAMRHAVMTIISDCELGWREGESRGEDNSPYDWEWCPRFLERNLSRLGIDAVEV